MVMIMIFFLLESFIFFKEKDMLEVEREYWLGISMISL